jgi:uncharacterized protein
MLLRLLLFALLVAVALFALKGRARRRLDDERGPPPSPPPSRSARAPDTMLACAHCGVHLPSSEALLDARGRPFCSPAHRDALQR